jgi:hypothetical protein
MAIQTGQIAPDFILNDSAKTKQHMKKKPGANRDAW